MIAVPVLLILLVLFVIVAAGASMVGLGGGVLYTPLQVYAGIGFHTAATTSLFLILITSLSATLVYRKANKIDWPLAIALESVTAVGGLLGGLFSAKISGPVLAITFSGVLVIAAIFMIHNFRARRSVAGRRFYYWQRECAGNTYVVNMLLALPLSFLAGAASGLVGVGGGVLKVPLMVLLLGVPMDIAVGSSAFMVGMTAAAGFSGHVISGHWDWKTSLILAAAAIIGGQLGARKSITLDKRKLRAVFGWFLLAIAVSMILKAVL